jgi:sugar/nucleoside kinase (ribokinase family)
MDLAIDVAACRYQALLGTGGIGSGMFFALDGDHTLGREESRSGRFLDRRDYCKLHIITHYVKALLGPDFPVIPAGQVGADDTGAALLSEMAEMGLDLRYVGRVPGRQTLRALCLIYPDGSGGNLTANDSACATVDAAYIAALEAEFALFAGQAVALAAPEVPLAARRHLLELGTRFGCWRVASFTSAEMPEVLAGDILRHVDFLAMNLDEASGIAGAQAGSQEPQDLAEAVIRCLALRSDHLQLAITAGRLGSWTWDGASLAYVPAFPVQVVGTAGAGDAHLAGIIAGVACGLPLAQAHELGALTAAMSVTSPHTISKEITRVTLSAFARTIDASISPAVARFLNA